MPSDGAIVFKTKIDNSDVKDIHERNLDHYMYCVHNVLSAIETQFYYAVKLIFGLITHISSPQTKILKYYSSFFFRR